jgi:hypothetical protein
MTTGEKNKCEKQNTISYHFSALPHIPKISSNLQKAVGYFSDFTPIIQYNIQTIFRICVSID